MGRGPVAADHFFFWIANVSAIHDLVHQRSPQVSLFSLPLFGFCFPCCGAPHPWIREDPRDRHVGSQDEYFAAPGSSTAPTMAPVTDLARHVNFQPLWHTPTRVVAKRRVGSAGLPILPCRRRSCCVANVLNSLAGDMDGWRRGGCVGGHTHTTHTHTHTLHENWKRLNVRTVSGKPTLIAISGGPSSSSSSSFPHKKKKKKGLVTSHQVSSPHHQSRGRG